CFFGSTVDTSTLHAFPTRRSSDLHPDPFGAAELVAGDREQVDVVEGDLLGHRRLDGVAVDEDAVGHRPHGGGDLRHRLDDAGLVVGPHDGHHRRLLVDGGGDGFRVHEAVAVHSEDLDGTADAAQE